MYPTFVKIKGINPNGDKMIEICGQDFTIHTYDWYIEDAIRLAKRWKLEQITYSRIMHLRTWIRENFQHDHNIPYEHLRSMRSCRNWIECVIHADFKYADIAFQETYKEQLQRNKIIFC